MPCDAVRLELSKLLFDERAVDFERLKVKVRERSVFDLLYGFSQNFSRQNFDNSASDHPALG